jgi:hypothetical protein
MATPHTDAIVIRDVRNVFFPCAHRDATKLLGARDHRLPWA